MPAGPLEVAAVEGGADGRPHGRLEIRGRTTAYRGMQSGGPSMLARIYQPARTAMQSGQARTRVWLLEFAPEQAQRVDPLMGWSGSGDMRGQVRLEFPTKEAALDYARRHGIPAQVHEPKVRKPVIRPKGYGSNFAHDRRGAWTH